MFMAGRLGVLRDTKPTERGGGPRGPVHRLARVLFLFVSM